MKPASGALTSHVTETGCATATGLAEGTESAAVTTVMKGTSASTASTATSTKFGMTPSLCAQVRFNTHTQNTSVQRAASVVTRRSSSRVKKQRFLTSSLTECHSSCKTCTGATNQECDECKDGWEEDDQEACVGKRSSGEFPRSVVFKCILFADDAHLFCCDNNSKQLLDTVEKEFKFLENYH